ncbi:histidine kinase [Rhodobacteraceae bacterium WD3A24]|nr:histidine kinase [Rhodobacteraceae bacterium WD3A24]
MLVSHILKSKPGAADDVVTVSADSRVADAAQLLSERRIGAVVILSDEGGVAGILSERDIVRELGRRGTGCLQDRVEEMMTSEIEHCTPADSTDEVLERMTAGRFRHMPVIQEGRMVGLISIGDVVKARLDELSREKDALEGMIMGR